MEGAILDVQHGSLKRGTGEFPRCFTFREGPIEYEILANRTAVEEDGLEPVVAMYWWVPGVFHRRFMGVRLHTISLRYEKLKRPILRPWKHVWVPAGVPAKQLPPITSAHSSKHRFW